MGHINLTADNFNSFDKALKDFFTILPFGRFLTDQSLDFEISLTLELKNIHNYCLQGEVVLAVHDNRILGLLGYRESEWDNEHFGYKVGKIDYFLVDGENPGSETIANGLMVKYNKWIKDRSIKVAIAKIDSSYFIPSKILQQGGFLFYECITQRCCKNPLGLAQAFKDVDYRFASQQDAEEIITMARSNTFEKSHFYLDDRFSKNKVDDLYSKWIKTALKSGSSSKIIVIEENGEIAGTFIYSLPSLDVLYNKTFANWEFVLINKKFRNKGLGKRLFEATIDACLNEGVEIIDSTMVDKNIISQNLHERYGFRLLNTYYTFHKWYN